MRQPVLLAALLAAALAAPAHASEPVFVRGTIEGAFIRLPNVGPEDVKVEAPDPRKFVITVENADFSTGARWPRAEFIEHVRVFGPELMGQGLSRVVLRTTVSGMNWRLEQERVDTLVILTGVTPLAEQAAEARSERQDDRQMRRQAREERKARHEAERLAEEEAMAAERAGEAARRNARRSSAADDENARLSRELEETRRRLAELEARLDGGQPARPTRTGNETARRPPEERMPMQPRPSVPPAEPAPMRVERSEDGMVRVPAGRFTMGTAMGYGFEDEVPAHAVELSAFEIDEREVTVGEFQSSPIPLPRQPEWNWDADQPVVNVSWGEAAQYCEWVGKRLPSEAEWEKAARGSDGRSFPWGNQWSPTRANSGMDGDGQAKAAPVGSYPLGASPYGALDMAGNVWEWTHDWYDESYYENSPTRDPQGPTRGTYRVAKGGSYEGAAATNLRSAIRMPLKGSARRDNVGFRCAR